MQAGKQGSRRWHNIYSWVFWPGLFLYFLGSKRARVLIVHGDEVLLVQENNRFKPDDLRWASPGGGIGPSESPAEGAARELYEELGIQAPPEAFTLLGVKKTGETGLRYTGYFYVLQLSVKPALQLDGKEIAAAAWLPLATLQDNQIRLEVRQALQLYTKQ